MRSATTLLNGLLDDLVDLLMSYGLWPCWCCEMNDWMMHDVLMEDVLLPAARYHDSRRYFYYDAEEEEAAVETHYQMALQLQ